MAGTRLKLLIFSDIHGDWKRARAVAGRRSRLLHRRRRPGDLGEGARPLRRTAAASAPTACTCSPATTSRRTRWRACARATACTTSTGALSGGTVAHRRARLFQPHALRHARRIQRSRNSPTACSRFADLKPLVLICHAPPYGTALDQIRDGSARGLDVGAASSSGRYQPEHFFCGHIHEAEGVAIEIGATRARNVGKQGVSVRIGLKPP